MAVLTVIVVAVVLAAAVWWPYSTGRLNGVICGGACGAEYISAPAEVGARPPAVAELSSAAPSAIDAAAVRGALSSLLTRRESLGSRVGVAVSDLSGSMVQLGVTEGLVPASTTKLLSGFAALRLIDPQTRFVTHADLDGDRVILVGGGDPYLVTARGRKPSPVQQADLRTLARRTAAALQALGATRVSIGFDDSLFTGPDFSPAWEPKYRGEVVAPIRALWVEQGVHKGRIDADPSRVAAERFAGELRAAGITVAGAPTRVEAPPLSTRLADVRSATLAQIVENVELSSDNEGAEVIARHAGLAAGRGASFAGAVEAIMGQLEAFEIDTTGVHLDDGSGLSRRNRIPPSVLVRVLALAGSSPKNARLLAFLPVAHVSGSLAGRLSRDPLAWGMVRAKTGTLTGVHSLAGMVTTRDGHVLAFAVIADATPADDARAQAAIDAIAGALAACDCGSASPAGN